MAEFLFEPEYVNCKLAA